MVTIWRKSLVFLHLNFYFLLARQWKLFSVSTRKNNFLVLSDESMWPYIDIKDTIYSNIMKNNYKLIQLHN